MGQGISTVADEVRAHLATARAALEKVRDAEVFGCPDTDVVVLIRQTEAVLRLGYTVQVRMAGEADERGLAHRHAAPSSTAWLRQVLLVSTAEARARLAAAHATIAQPLPSGGQADVALPELAAAVDRGDLAPAQIRIVTATMAVITGKTTPDTAAMCQTVLVEQAAVSDPHALQKVADHLLAMADADADEPEDPTSKVEMHIGTRRPDGLTPIRGLLDDIGIQTLRQVIESLTAPSATWNNPEADASAGDRPDPEAGAGAGDRDGSRTGADAGEGLDLDPDARGGDDSDPDADDELAPNGEADPSSEPHDDAAGDGPVFADARTGAAAAPRPVGDDRGRAARRAHALTEALRRFLDCGLGPQDGGFRPHIALTISEQDLRTGLGAGLLDYGTSISAARSRMLACDCQIIPAVLGSQSEPLDVGRAARTITPAIRRALNIRDKGCVWPHCDRPPAWCDGHHIVHWVDLGETSTENTALLCHYHHVQIHLGHWQIRMAADHHPELIAPKWIDPDQKPLRNTLHQLPTRLRN